MSKSNDLKKEIHFFNESVSNIFELYYFLISLLITFYKYSNNQIKHLKKAKLDVTKKINNHPIILREKIRLRLIKLIKDNFNIR